jgi:hypothetical protein
MTPDTRAALRRQVEALPRYEPYESDDDAAYMGQETHGHWVNRERVLALLDTAPEPETRPERASEHLGAAFLEAWDKARAEPETPPTCDWQLMETAPKDGSFVLACHGGPWHEQYEQWRAPMTVSWRAFHPNAPGKTTWRDATGRPVEPTYWMPMLDQPKAKEEA